MIQRFRRIAGHEYTRYIGLGMLFGLVVLAVALIWRGSRDETIVLQVQPITDRSTLRVYVGGEVRSPGLYTLERGSRVAEAIAAAGGVTDAGDTTSLGMAAPLRDADQIIVASRPATGDQTDITAPASGGPSSSDVVNINAASAAELDSLPGIGPVLAERIVEYRLRHGFFRSVDELDAVHGISERIVEELRPLVTTGP